MDLRLTPFKVIAHPGKAPRTAGISTPPEAAVARLDRISTPYRDRVSVPALPKSWHGAPGPIAGIRAFYPEVRLDHDDPLPRSTPASALAMWPSPGRYAATITRPDLFQELPDAADRPG